MKKNIEGYEVLRRIVGFRLTSVEFILDYVKLDFDSEGNLAALVWPEVWVSGKKFNLNDTDYRNSLCELIGHNVKAVQVSCDERIVIRMENDSDIVVPASHERPGNERAIFTAPGGILFVWYRQ